MEALGFIDFSPDIVPVDLHGQVNTGLRINLKNSQTVTFVLFKGVGTATQDPVLTLNAQNAKTGGTSQTLAALTRYYAKSAVSLTGQEQWVLTTQGAGSTMTLTGEAAKQGVYVIPVNATSLPSGFQYVSLDVGNVGANAQIGGMLAVLSFMDVQRKPTNLLAGLN